MKNLFYFICFWSYSSFSYSQAIQIKEDDFYPFKEGFRWEYRFPSTPIDQNLFWVMKATGVVKEFEDKQYHEVTYGYGDGYVSVYRCKVNGVYYEYIPYKEFENGFVRLNMPTFSSILNAENSYGERIIYKDNANVGDYWSYSLMGIRWVVKVVEKGISINLSGKEYTDVVHLIQKAEGYESQGIDVFLANGIGIIKMSSDVGSLYELANFYQE